MHNPPISRTGRPAPGCYDEGDGETVRPTCAEITAGVETYNSNYAVYDCALRSALGIVQGAPPSFARFVAEVCLVADWGSIRLDNFPFRDRLAMAVEIERSWSVLEPMRSWKHLDWDTEMQKAQRGGHSVV